VYAAHGNKILNERVLRVFASRSKRDQGVIKHKTLERVEKIANTPARCFIENGRVKDMPLPSKLDVEWYIVVVKKRLKDFLLGGDSSV